MCQGGKPDTGKFHSSYIGMNVCGSAYENGCVVDGTWSMAHVLRQRIEYFYYSFRFFYVNTLCPT